jgi:hypothetical protein
LLFIALWTMADREGRLEDRPKRIKAEALPYDDCDAEELLAELEMRRFIVRYEVAGSRFIQIITFSNHQNPHVKEAPSTIPPPGECGAAPDKHSASTVQAQCDAQPEPERAGRIPDSGFPLTDSPSRIPRIESAPPAKQAANRSPSGSRIPDGFPASDEIAWCRSERPDLDAAALREKFRDYWTGVPGQKGRKADWPATWRNFVRSEFVRPQARASPPRHSAAAEAGLALAGMTRNRAEVIDV